MPDEITKDTFVNDVVDVLKGLSACSEAVTWFEQYKDEPMGTLTDNLGDEQFLRGWAIWYIMRLGKKCSIDIRKQFIHKIRHSPVKDYWRPE